MTRAWMILAALALPLSAFAGEQTSASTKTTSTTTKAAAPAPPPADSPLVAAARRANRKNRKATTILITNESLRHQGGDAHITTTAQQKDLVMPKPLDPPSPTIEMLADRTKEIHRQQLAAEAEKRRKAEEVKAAETARRAAASDDGLFEDGYADPAQREKNQEDVAQEKPPQR